MSRREPIETERLIVRLPEEADRERFVELWTDDEFQVFSPGTFDVAGASVRFDRMLERAAELTFAKQPIVDRASGRILGYTGVDTFEFEGETRLEYGYRLDTSARGKGYATEAGQALLAHASQVWEGELLAMIDPRNDASRNVLGKLGFEFWKQDLVEGFVDDLFRRRLP
ncbi:MAG: GNAT family N-acetyltransferase [Actinomycetota bacterium]